jgi:hypothetical protein
MVLDLSEAYCGDVSIAYTVYDSIQNTFCLSGVMTITCINVNKAANAMSILSGLQRQGGIQYRVGEDNRIHLKISQGIDVKNLTNCLVKALANIGCTTSVFKNS